MVGDSERFLEDNLVRHRDVAHWAVPAAIALILAALSIFAYGEYFSRDFTPLAPAAQTFSPATEIAR